MTNHMYRSNRTPEKENFKEIPSAMHFGSDAAACVCGGGGGGETGLQCYYVIDFCYLEFLITTLLLMYGVCKIIFNYKIFQIP